MSELTSRLRSAVEQPQQGQNPITQPSKGEHSAADQTLISVEVQACASNSAITYCIFGHIDLAAIERASIRGRGILNLVKVLKGAVKHMREDFTALGGDAHISARNEVQVSWGCDKKKRGPG